MTEKERREINVFGFKYLTYLKDVMTPSSSGRVGPVLISRNLIPWIGPRELSSDGKMNKKSYLKIN